MKKKFLLRLTWSIEGTLSRRVERKRWFEGRSVDFDAISSRREPRKRGGRRRKRSWTREGNGLKYILHPFASRPFEVHTPLTCPFLDTTCFTTSLPFLSPAEIFRRSWKRSKRGGGGREGMKESMPPFSVALVVCASKIVPCVNKIKCGIIFLFCERTRGLSFDICSNIGFSISGERRSGMEKFYSTLFLARFRAFR